VGDAGLLFDPNDPVDIGRSLERLFADDGLCEDLKQKGRRRLSDFDWSRTALAYRAVYRKAAGRKIADEDRKVLAHDWMRNPQR
jgi:glycosyltransferase involved in cell wall biosynthesis